MRRQNESKEKKAHPVKNNIYMLKLMWRVSPATILLSFIVTFLDFALWAGYNVLFLKYLFGSPDYNRSFAQSALFVIGFMAVMMVVGGVQAWFDNRYKRKIEPRFHQYLNGIMFEKATNVDIACFETPEFYDNYTKATAEVLNRAISVLSSTSSMLGSMFASVWVITNMFSISILAGFFSFLPMIGSFLFGLAVNKLHYKKSLDDIPHKRKQDYVNRTMYLQKFSKEVRLSKIYDVMKNTYKEGFNGIIKNVNKYRVRIFWLEDTKNALCFPVVFEGMWLFATYLSMVTKTILIGEFAVLSRSIVATTWMLTAFADGLSASFKNGLYIENLREFLSYEAKIPEDFDGDPVPQTIDTLELKNVSFMYTGSDKLVLDNVSMIVRAGEKISLVGHNGAGKSTLVKLIMRLYDPTSGEIYINGKDIRSFNLKAYRNLIGTTFQDFQMLSMTVAENVLMEKVTTNEQRERAIAALKMSGVYEKIEQLPNKEDSIITREFDDDGVVLSGGQFQRIAVARAFAKDSPIVLLDEPSSALDPVAEYMMYETIMKLSDSNVLKSGQGRLSVIISHRLSSAVMADRVYLLENGGVVETGTHKELMLLNGTYADMFKKQAESYLQTVEPIFARVGDIDE